MVGVVVAVLVGGAVGVAVAVVVVVAVVVAVGVGVGGGVAVVVGVGVGVAVGVEVGVAVIMSYLPPGANAVDDTPPPCDTCTRKLWCKRDGLACWEFAKYCYSAHRKIWYWRQFPDLPNTEVYQHIYPTEVIPWPVMTGKTITR